MNLPHQQPVSGWRHRQSSGRHRPRFEPTGWAVMRAPLLPVEAYPRQGPGEFQQDTLLPMDARLRAALAVGSEHLYAALQRTPASSPDAPRLRKKLLRYQIRMSTRATPLGLFAGVGLIEWGTATDVRLEAGPPRTRARLDMGWLFGLIAELERDPEVRKHLRFYVNQLAFMRAGHVRVDDRMGVIERGVAGSVPGFTRMTGAAEELLTNAGKTTPATYARLVERLLARPGATAEKVDGLIDELLERSLLLTDGRPPLTTGEPGRYVYDRLRGVAPAKRTRDSLGELLRALRRWDASPVEERADGWAALTAQATALHHSPRASTSAAIRVDTMLPLSTRRMHRAVADAAAHAADILLLLAAHPTGPVGLRAYRERFESRYGPEREVPLLELVDPDYGLGPPDDGDRAVDSRRQPSSAAQMLRSLAIEALHERRLVAELDDELLAPLRTSSLGALASPRSVEVAVQVAATSNAAIDAGDFKLIVVGGAEPAGPSLGRFANLLGPQAEAAFNDLGGLEGAGDQRLRAELVYLAGRLDAANVAVRPALGSHEIVYGTTPGVGPDRVIPLEELVVTTRGRRFIVRWPHGGATIAAIERTALNPLLAPPAIRFLRMLERGERQVFGPVDRSLANDLPVLPRLEYGRLVLAPARWRVHGLAEASAPAVFPSALAAWRERWSVPRWVRLADGDNWLTLDLDDPTHVDIFREELHRSGDVGAMAVQEALPAPGDSWLPGPEGRHAVELVVPLVAAVSPAAPIPTPSEPPLVSPSVQLFDRVRPPGSEWLFLKVYCPPPMQDSLIAGALRALVAVAEASRLATDWFFVRYEDPEPHLRIRFHGNPQALVGNLLPQACSWAEDLIRDGLCLRFVVDTYEREIERYGGVAGARIAEELFGADSRAVVELLAVANHLPTLDRIDLAVLSVDALLRDLGISGADRLAWYRAQTKLSATDGEEYRNRRPMLRRVLAKGAVAEEGGDAIDGIMVNRQRALRSVAAQMRDLERDQGGAHVRAALLTSSVHMHCNRLLGFGFNDDRVLRLARRTRESLARVRG
jgi:thiopeptide-type bacteriocin biosynthesis protein